MHIAPSPTISPVTPAPYRIVAAALFAAFWISGGCMMMADQQGPSGTVEEVSPAPGSQGVAVTEPVVIRFDMPLDRGSVASGAVLAQRLDSGESVPVDVELDAAGTRLTVRPAPAWPLNRTVQVCLSERIRTEAGGALSAYRVDPEFELFEAIRGTVCYEFTTEEGLSVRRAYLLAEQGQVMVYFSQDVDPESISAAAVMLVTSSGQVEAEFRYSPTRNRLAVYVSDQLSITEPLSIQLPGSIRTDDGHQLAVGEGETLDVHYPQIRIK
jgi:hypothetical protein